MPLNLKRDAAEAGKLGRAIVAKRAGLTSALSLAIAYAQGNGLIPQPWGGTVMHAVNVGFDVLGALLMVGGVLWAQHGTTPADPAKDPTDKYGNALVSELSVGPHSGRTTPPAGSAALDAANAIYPTG